MAIDRLRKKIGKGRHLSTIKRARQNKARRLKNRGKMSAMRTAIKRTRESKSAAALKEAIPLIARMAQKGLIHKKKAERLISRLTKAIGKK